MRTFAIRIAGLVAEISASHPQVLDACRDFIVCDAEPDVRVTTTQHDIDATRRDCEDRGIRYPFKDGTLEITTVLHKLADELVRHDVLLLHGAVVAAGNDAYLFAAPSGTGKTTHVRRWLQECPGAYVVNGDKPFVRLAADGTALACGSPWAGKEGAYADAMVPLRAIVLMDRADENCIEQISFAEAFPTLLEQAYRPDDANRMRRVLRLMRRLDPCVSFWRFRFDNFREDCFRVAHDALCGRA